MLDPFLLGELVRFCRTGRTRRRDLLEAALTARAAVATLGHPLDVLAGKLRVRAPLPAQLRFQTFERWPRDLLAALAALPPGFIESADPSAEVAWWTFGRVLAGQPKLVLELGCSSLTPVLGVAVARLTDPVSGPRLLVLEREPSRARAGREACQAAGVGEHVEVVSEPDRVPPGVELMVSTGRSGPAQVALTSKLASGASVIVDGPSTGEGNRSMTPWLQEPELTFDGFVSVGDGVALLTRR